MLVPHRNYQSPEYRYGFQGQEKDDEVKGNGNSINYKYRMHDPRIGRFFAVDPLFRDYPHNSPYAFSENKVIGSTELEGLESNDLYTIDGVTSPGAIFGEILGDAFNATQNFFAKGFELLISDSTEGLIIRASLDKQGINVGTNISNEQLGEMFRLRRIGGELQATPELSFWGGTVETIFDGLDVLSGLTVFGGGAGGGATNFAAKGGGAPAMKVLAELSKRRLSLTAMIKNLKGRAKSAKWSKSEQGINGPGLKDHFTKHGTSVGASSSRAYNLSARTTIQKGRKFSYKDRTTGKSRIGYWDKATGLFTATGQNGKNTKIFTHFSETWENLKKLPGFSTK